MITTARFKLERRRQLKALFTQQRLVDLWRKLVKEQMRDFEIKDLHDYYDFNFSIEARADSIIERLLSGNYRAETPLIYRTEKKFGVCRHLLIPSPSDALVFQLLTDELYPAIVKAQPSEAAFYARDRHNMDLPHDHDEAPSYPWFILWPKFQKEIWKFSRAYPFLVTTDLTNYFDNIGLRELRHVISAITKTEEVYLDLLFSLIEDLSWQPDYLPRSHRGLPTINIEAPRLLAHALLFEIDTLLSKRTKNSFVRWMDDINFGATSQSAANLLLGEMNDVLKSRGLALNLGKTAVMTSKDAEYHFLFRENVRLNRIAKRAKTLKPRAARVRLAGVLRRELARHLATSEARHKDKVTKRYLTVLGYLGVSTALAEVKDIYVEQPALRTAVLEYLTKLPFSRSVAKAFVELLDSTEVYDDATRFGLTAAIVGWSVPRKSAGYSFLRKVKSRLAPPKSTFDWFCWVFFLAKYGQPHEVVNIAQVGKKFGAREPFFARQRITALSRGIGVSPQLVRDQWQTEVSTGSSDSASVATNLLSFAAAPFPTKKSRLYPYLFPTTPHRQYPLAKFLLLCVVAHSESLAGKTKKRQEVKLHIVDRWYRHWLRQIHPHWF